MTRSQKWGEDTAVVSIRVPVSLNSLIRDIKIRRPGEFNRLACNLLSSTLMDAAENVEDRRKILIDLAARNPQWMDSEGRYFRAWADGPVGRDTLRKCNLTAAEAWDLILESVKEASQ